VGCRVRNLLAILLVRALVLGALVGILACAAAPAFSQTTAERLNVFTRELNRAADTLRVARPVVHVVSLEEALAKGSGPLVAAYIWVSRDVLSVPNYVLPVQLDVVWSQLMSASDARLRCWARHEMTHVLLGHERGARDAREAMTQHDAVRHYMEARWRQDSACLID